MTLRSAFVPAVAVLGLALLGGAAAGMIVGGPVGAAIGGVAGAAVDTFEKETGGKDN